MLLKNKRILIISYYFPPLGGIPPRRSLRFTRNLPSFGWQPVVLTVAEPAKRETAWDYELLKEIEGLPIEVIRTNWMDILRVSDFLGRLKLYRFRAWYSIFCRRFPPDNYVGWYPYGINAGMKVIEKQRVEFIYSNSAPFTAHLIALKLKKKTGLPWVADFRDPWADDPLRQNGLFKWQMTLEKIQEARVVKNADHVITASKNYASFLKRKYPKAKKKITTIYNGYDWPVEIPHLEKYQNKQLEFVYAGAFYGPQSPIGLLKSLEQLLLKGDVTKKEIRFTIIGGHGDNSWREKFANSPVNEIISIVGFIPNSQVRERLAKASCLVIHQARERGDLIVLGKTFEYISVGRPILALVPRKSEILNILEQSGCLFKQAEPDSEEEIMEAIMSTYESWRSGKLSVKPNWEYTSQFYGKNLVAQFVEILNSITSKSVVGL